MKSNPIFGLPFIAVLLLATPVIAITHLDTTDDFKDAQAEVDMVAAAPGTAEVQKLNQEFRDIVRANTKEPVDYSKSLKCAAPRAATPQQAIATYTSLVAIEEPDRIRILRRGNSWLVFQGAIMINGHENSYGYYGVPMEGARHLAKVDMCDGSVLPVLPAGRLVRDGQGLDV
jgi:hypothetical protein